MNKGDGGVNEKKAYVRGVSCVVLGGVCWGFSGACGQYLFMYQNADSRWLSVIRMLSAGVVLLAIGFIKDRKRAADILKNKKDVIQLTMFAVMGLMLCQYTYLTAISYSNAGTATVLQYMAPILIMIFICIKKRRPPERIEAVSIVLAVFGTFLLATHGSIDNMVLSKEGLIWGLMAAAGLMLYTLLPGNIISKWGSLIVTGYGMLIGGVVLALLVRVWNIETELDFKGVIAVIAIIILGTVMAYTLYLQGVSDIGPVKASMLSSVEPVAAAVFSAVWLKTEFMFIDLIGFICIMSTVFLLSRAKK